MTRKIIISGFDYLSRSLINLSIRNAKVVALVCDDQLFVKTTSEGKAFVGLNAFEELP